MAAISEKDANIALLELSSSKKKKTQEEVAALKREKDSLVQQLKQQVGLRTPNHTHTNTTNIGIQVDTRKAFCSVIKMRRGVQRWRTTRKKEKRRRG